MMLEKLVRNFESAADDQAALDAARAIVAHLRGAILLIDMSPMEGDKVLNVRTATTRVFCRGRRIGPLYDLEMKLAPESNSVTVYLPEVQGHNEQERMVRKVMEDSPPLVRETDEQEDLLQAVGVRVVRHPID